jgi:hypothetical protein
LEHVKAALLGLALALLASFGQAVKDQSTNTPAYRFRSVTTKKKSFMALIVGKNDNK